MMKHWIFIICTLLPLLSCTGLQKPVYKQALIRPDAQRLFPDGIYVHHVEIELLGQQKKKFKVVVSLTNKLIKVVGLSPFNTTLFKISDDLERHQMTKDFYGSIPQGMEDRFVSFYKILRGLLLHENQNTLFKSNTEIKMKGFYYLYNEDGLLSLFDQLKARVSISLKDYDKNRIPRSIEMRHRQFIIRAVVFDYKDFE